MRLHGQHCVNSPIADRLARVPITDYGLFAWISYHGAGLSSGPFEDCRVAALDRVLSLHHLPDRADRAHDGRSCRVGGEVGERLDRATTIGLAAER